MPCWISIMHVGVVSSANVSSFGSLFYLFTVAFCTDQETSDFENSTIQCRTLFVVRRKPRFHASPCVKSLVFRRVPAAQ